MGPASGVPDTHQRNKNDIPDFLRAMHMKLSVKDGKICNHTTSKKKLPSKLVPCEESLNLREVCQYTDLLILFQYT